MRLIAHAKINLALAVGPPIPAGQPHAGFHPIASIMHAIDLAGTVEIVRTGAPSGASEHRVEWSPDAPRPSPIDWPMEKDLVVRAHRALETRVQRALPARVRVAKRVPVGAGLGGGSSEAAAALVGLDREFDLRLGHAALAEVARTIGSDVAFFLDDGDGGGGGGVPRPALVTGAADTIVRLPRRAGWLVLALPAFGCPTGEVYRAFDATRPGPIREDAVRALAADRSWPPGGIGGAAGGGGLFNDLTSAAEAVRPALGSLRRGLESACGRTWHMSGSGSTLFLPVATSAEAHAIASKMRRDRPDAEYVPARLV